MDSDPYELIQRIRIILAGRKRRKMEDASLICAAVLVPLLCKDGEWHVLVTQRSQNVEHHKGQISFPGGACEPGDANPKATALRETFEEIGVPVEEVEILGALDDLPTITNFVVTPFVGVIFHPITYLLNGHEVEAVIEIPLSFLLDPTHLRVEQWEYDGHPHDVLFWDYRPDPHTLYTVWGATARILKSLLDLIS
jgi:8-oxo-dGTP pyrophosphatase MutT (NUDIX family)